jgi:hypothetical protein
MVKTKQRARVKALKLSKKDTKFIAIGRNTWDRKAGYLYLGPLHAETTRDAKQEAKKTFPVWQDMLVIPTKELSKSLRGSMARGRKVCAGVTRIVWPEVPPTFDDVLAKFRKKYPAVGDSEVAALRQVWANAGEPWLSVVWMRKQNTALMPVPTRVTYKNKLFRCVKCKAEAKSPLTIQHASPLCVPIAANEEKLCAAIAKGVAKLKADKLSKRAKRRAAKKAALEKAKARNRADKKRARTRAKSSRDQKSNASTKPTAKRTAGKSKSTRAVSASRKKSATKKRQ